MTKEFWEILRDKIESDPDLSASALAVKAGLSNSAIRQMITNERDPRLGTAKRICEALGTTYETFMANDPRGDFAPLGHNDIRVTVHDNQIIVHAAASKSAVKSLIAMIEAAATTIK